MATAEEFARLVFDGAHKIAKAVDEAPTGVAPGYSSALGGAVLPNGKLRSVSGAAAGGQLSAAAYIDAFGGTAVSTSGTQRIQYDTVYYDPDTLITTGSSWAYAVPATGLYRVELHLELTSGLTDWTAGDLIRVQLRRSSIFLNAILIQHYIHADELSDTLIISGAQPVILTAGWLLNVVVSPSLTSSTHEFSGSGGMDFAIYRLT